MRAPSRIQRWRGRLAAAATPCRPPARTVRSSAPHPQIQKQVPSPHPARDRNLCRFHADSYVAFLCSITPEMQQDQIRALKRFNVGVDCPVFDGLYSFCQKYTATRGIRWRRRQAQPRSSKNSYIVREEIRTKIGN